MTHTRGEDVVAAVTPTPAQSDQKGGIHDENARHYPPPLCKDQNFEMSEPTKRIPPVILVCLIYFSELTLTYC